MTNKKTTHEANDSSYIKRFQSIKNFMDWLALWNANITTAVAIGLLHALPKYFWQDKKPVGVRFLMEFLDATPDHSCRVCDCTQVRDTAKDILNSRFFKEPRVHYMGEQLPWFSAFCEDPDLFPLALKILAQCATSAAQTEIRDRFVEQCFIAHYGDEYSWPGPFQASVRANLVPLLELSHANHVRASDPSDEMLAALRKLAFQPDRAGKPPRDLDEALIHGNGAFASKLLLKVTYRRATARQEREVSVKNVRELLTGFDEKLAGMLAKVDQHAPTTIKAVQAKITELTAKLAELETSATADV